MSKWIFLFTALFAAPSARAETYVDPLPPGPDAAPVVQSYYTPRIMNFLKTWPSPYHRQRDAGPIWQRAIRTPGKPNYVGLVKHMVVKAPLSRVVEITERFEDYPKIWSDVSRITVLSRTPGRAVVEWLRPPPAIVMPEIRYKLLYTWDKSAPGRVVYRQQLVSGNTVRFQDSLVVLEDLGGRRTRVTVLNFFEPDAGPFADIVTRLVWPTSMRNSFMEDIAFLAHCEHPDWDVRRLRSEATRTLDRNPVVPIKYLDGFSLD